MRREEVAARGGHGTCLTVPYLSFGEFAEGEI